MCFLSTLFFSSSHFHTPSHISLSALTSQFYAFFFPVGFMFFPNSQLFVVLPMVPETVLTTSSHSSATFLSSFSLLRTTHQFQYLFYFHITFLMLIFNAEFPLLRNYKRVDDEAKFILFSRTRLVEKDIGVYFRSICASFRTIAPLSLLSVSAYIVMRIWKSHLEQV